MNSRLHRWWLWGCFAALLLASFAGGFGVAVTAVFIGIYLTGLVLIGPDEPAPVAEAADEEAEAEESDDDGEPYPDDDETGTDQTDSDESLEPSDSSRP